MFVKIKRAISQNKYFWKYKHLIPNLFTNPKWRPKTINKIFVDIIKQKKINSILDFGFGRGEFLTELHEARTLKFLMGVDINHKNVINLNKKLNHPNVFLAREFDREIFTKKIHDFGQKKIDLIVFDRVLYIFSDKELFKLLDSISEITSYIFIDDFMKTDLLNSSEYLHRDWIKILKNYRFKIEFEIDSINGQPINCYSRTLLFSRDCLKEN